MRSEIIAPAIREQSANRAVARGIARPAFSIGALKFLYKEIWLNTSEGPPSLGKSLTVADQTRNEAELDQSIARHLAGSEKWRGTGAEGWQGKAGELMPIVKPLLSNIFSLPAIESDGQFLEDYLSVGIEFIQQAREFDPSLSGESLFQALRNIWIINSLQTYLGKQATLTRSTMAYSLLYPYTDNLLDDPDLPKRTKDVYAAQVGNVLLGRKPITPTKNLEKVIMLVEMIEQEYPREDCPAVYESLLAIHRGQERSLEEQRGDSRHLVSEADLLDISIEKGGTSVLADGYIAAGVLSNKMIAFSFGLGAALQLIDDLQDMRQDCTNGHQTIFTKQASRTGLERTTNRLLNFIQYIFSSEEHLQTRETRLLAELSLASCRLLVFEAIARERDRFRAEYISTLEPFSPFRFEYLEGVKERIEEGIREFERPTMLRDAASGLL